ncbi:MAG: RNA polymerase, sigma-24 subunit, ECF subfamily [Bacteroidetes bacterium]|nr:MAG: RNA polymerase, sigma-24 subunit, ECF subfamily [Bacteroidota bacterium]
MFDIVTKIKTDKTEAIAWLYDRYGKKLYGYAVSQWKINEDDAWELIYKTLYKVISSAGNYTFEDENRFTGFVFRIFTNYLRNHYRDEKNKGVEMVELLEKDEKTYADRTESSGEKNTRSPLMKCLQQVLHALQDWQRIVLLMRAQDYPYESIAPYVDRPAEQLKVYHLRLKKTVTEKTNTCLEKKQHEQT